MSAPFIVPFNFQPDSVSVITSSYTIPAGKYARVVVNLEGSATVTINGTTALRGTQNSVLASDNLAVRVSGATEGALINDGGTGSVSLGAAYNETTDQKTVISDFWCPTGTVIGGTGTWRAIVTIYSAIS
jgi:hypothetical protein